MNGLEKIVSCSKKHWKEIVTAIALPFIFTNNVKAIDNSGELEIYNMGSGDTGNGGMKIVHHDGFGYASEGKDILDSLWSRAPENPIPTWLRPSSIIYDATEYELQTDFRPENSTSSVNITLKVIHKQGGAKQISCSNYLKLEFGSIQGAYPNFGSKPITFWKQDANDPNLYYLTANVRKEILQNEGIIPLAPLNGTYESEKSYLRGWVRFDTPFVHLNNDSIVNLKDFAIWARNFGRTGITDTNRADPNDVGAWADYDLDGNVDVNDLSIFTDYYLTSKTYHLEDGWILEEKD